jgi:alginate O-acetyltransferase complex protein AlgI
MYFNSLTYLLFLFLFTLLYWQSNLQVRIILIFTSSLLFYGFSGLEFFWILLFSITFNWFLAKYLINLNKSYRFFLLLISLTFNIGLLFYFKYLIFFINNMVIFSNFLGIKVDPFFLNIILPLGISFYTFQIISYVLDVYRGTIKPENNFILFGCYVIFFPQLVAGPILRSSEIIPQFLKKTKFSYDHIIVGLTRILYGLFLKVFLADNIAPLVDYGYTIPANTLSAIDVWTLAFLFGFQIYFDFSAYSHIAVGSARLIGIYIPENFNFPYIATSPKEFWKRWHISLSSWVRDYIYLFLTRLKVFNKSTGGFVIKFNQIQFFPLFITWGIMGLWHGANWTFLVWGIYHFLFICINRLIAPLTRNLNRIIAWWGGLIFTIPAMMLAWVPFRAQSISDVVIMWSKIFDLKSYTQLSMRENTYLVTFMFFCGFFVTYFFKKKIFNQFKTKLFSEKIFNCFLIGFIIFFVIIFFRSNNQFIYFQF